MTFQNFIIFNRFSQYSNTQLAHKCIEGTKQVKLRKLFLEKTRTI